MKKRTKLISILTASSLIALTSLAQTNAPPSGGTLWDFVTTGSNYWVAPFGTYAPDAKTAGGGVALGYRVSEVVNPILRLDYFNGALWVPSLTAQIQPPRTLLGKIPIVPFGIAGAATPISGAGVGNGTFVTVLGAGAAFKFDSVSSAN